MSSDGSSTLIREPFALDARVRMIRARLVRALRRELGVPRPRAHTGDGAAVPRARSLEGLVDEFVSSLEDLFDREGLSSLRAQIHDVLAGDPYVSSLRIAPAPPDASHRPKDEAP